MSESPPSEFPVPGHQLPPTDPDSADPHHAPRAAHSAFGGSEHRALRTMPEKVAPNDVFRATV